eukprot:gene39276-62925_t
MVGEVPVRRDGEAQPFFTADALLDEALEMAGDDPAYRAAIDFVRADPLRGVESSPYGDGPIATVKTLRAREVHGFDVRARPGEILRVAAIGDGDTALDLSVRDSAGRMLCQGGFGDHYPVCTVRPRNGEVRIEVVNRDPQQLRPPVRGALKWLGAAVALLALVGGPAATQDPD